MKKLLFVFAALMMAGSAMADRVVTFDAATDKDATTGGNVTATAYTLEKDGVTITVSNGTITDEHYRLFANSEITVTTNILDWEQLYPDEDSYGQFYGRIWKIEFVCTANGDAQYGPGNIDYDGNLVPGEYTINENVGVFDATYYNTRENYYFEANHQVRCTKIIVTLNAEEVEEPVTPPVEPTVKTGAPTFHGYTEDGIHGYFVEIIPTEEGSVIYYRVIYPDGTETDWTEYEDILGFEGDGKYRVEAYAVVDGKLPSEQIAYEFVVAPVTGIDEMMNGKTVAGVRYFNMAGQEMQQANGLTIVVTTYTDGTTSAAKVMK